MRSKVINCLYIEDDSSDVDLAQTALNHVSDETVQCHIEVAEDGEQALQYLDKSGPFLEANTPDLVLLDLNLPKVHGREVLKKMKESSVLKHIPVIVLTTSEAQSDVNESYRLGANVYVKKPMSFGDYKEIFHLIYEFWCKKAALPKL